MASFRGIRTALRHFSPLAQVSFPQSLLLGTAPASNGFHSAAPKLATTRFVRDDNVSLEPSTNSHSGFPQLLVFPFALAAVLTSDDSKKVVSCDPRSTQEDLRDAVMARYVGACPACEVSNRFNGVHNIKVNSVIVEVEQMLKKAERDNHPLVDQMMLEKSSTHVESKFVYRWVSKRCGAKIPRGSGHTDSELKAGTYAILSGECEAKHAFTLYGINNSTYRRFVAPICKSHRCKTIADLKQAVKSEAVTKESLHQSIYRQSKPTLGRPTLLSQDEETILIGSSEMKAQFGRGKSMRRVAKDLNDAVQATNPRRDVKPDSQRKFAKRALARTIKREPGRNGVKKSSRKGVVKASKLSKRRARQSDPRLQWIMMHRITDMYRSGMEQQNASLNEKLGIASVTPTPMKKKRSAEVAVESKCDRPTKRAASVSTTDTSVQKPSIAKDERLYEHDGKFYHVPDDLKHVQPRADQIWNADEIGFDPDGKWDRVVCTFKWCMTEKLWMTKTGEKAPFWVSMLYFVRADGSCHLSPTIVHKGKNLTKAHALYLDNWNVHVTESGYMNRDGFFKAMTHFVHGSNASAENPQYLFLDGHDSHWDHDALEFAKSNHVHVFFLKAGDSENDQPLDNGPNALLKRCYAIELAAWEEEYPNTPLTYSYFNKIMAATFRSFKLKCAPAIVDSFKRTHLYPLQFPTHTSDETVGLASIASMQVGPGKAAEELERITTHQNPLTCNIEEAETMDPHVIISAKQGENADRNIVVRSAVLNIAMRSLVKPAQEVAKEAEFHKASAKLCLGSGEVSADSRMNPDTSVGLYVTQTVLAQAKAVEANKAAANEKKRLSSIKAEKDRVENRERREATYHEFIRKYKGKTMEAVDIDARRNGPLTQVILMAMYQHMGGRPCDLVDSKKDTILASLRTNPEFLDIVDANVKPTFTGEATESEEMGDAKNEASKLETLLTDAVPEVSRPKAQQQDTLIEPATAAAATGTQASTASASVKKNSEATTVAIDLDEMDDTSISAEDFGSSGTVSLLRDVPITRYGSIKNVLGDGNCGYHSALVGLERLGLVPPSMGITNFRRDLHDFASSNRIVLQGDLFVSAEEGPIPAKFIRKDGNSGYPKTSDKISFDSFWYSILNRIWKENVSFDDSASHDFWFDAGYIPPILALKYGVPVVVYGKNAGIDTQQPFYVTNTFAPTKNGGVELSQDWYPTPPLNGSIPIIHNGSNHFMALVPHP